jgi:hypothetical protein
MNPPQSIEQSLRQWCWTNGWDDSFGRTSVIDRGKLLKWRTRLATLRRWVLWLRRIIKQRLCWHPQWMFNASGKIMLPYAEVLKHLGGIWAVREAPISAIRHNFICVRCRKRSPRYTPDFGIKLHELH